MNADELLTLGIPDSKLARDVTQFIRGTESDLLFPPLCACLLLGSHDRKPQRHDL
jgi:hypothetical protein